jgi:prepilin-type processing-associated H-X9-DG protein
MNEYCGNSGNFFINPNYKLFMKFTDFGSGLGASDCWVFLDENPLSISDGFFYFDPIGNSVGDRPAVNHGNQSSFAFADGHAELHKWQNTYLSTTSQTAGSDVKWLGAHGTVHK